MYSVVNRLAGIGGLLVLSPILLGIALAIKLEDGGPVFFKQARVGENGRIFTCYKFRTMLVGAEHLLKKWEAENHVNWQVYVQSNFKLKNDPRITKSGFFLRKSSLDELAQLINIARGDMAVVGPRPLIEREVQDYGKERFDIYIKMKPGLTGLWQTSGRSNTTFDERADFDMTYYKNRSLALDIKLIAKTFTVLFKRDGAY